MIFLENTQRRTANTIRCPLLVFTVPHDFTLNAEIQYALLWPGHCEQLARFAGALPISTPDGEYDYEKEYNFYEYQE